MRARTLMLGVIAFCIGVATAAVATPMARAAEPEPNIYQISFGGFPNLFPTLPYGTSLTAFRTGDTPRMQLLVHSIYAPSPIVSGDLSPLGGPTLASTTGSSTGYGASHQPSYSYDFVLPALDASVSDGMKAITVTAIDANGTRVATTTHITVDNTLPTIALTDLHFSTTTPRGGDTLFISGQASGTGSRVRVASVWQSLFNDAGTEIGATSGARLSYNATTLNNAFASSTDGSFTNVPYTIVDGNEYLPEAASYKLTVTVYDEAGNIASTSISATLPKTLPPAFPPNDAPVLVQIHNAIEPYRLPIGSPPLNLASSLVATGTIASFAAPLSYFKPLTGTEQFSFALMDAAGHLLDCKTPVKTADEWGMSHIPRDPHAPIVAVGTFSGSACEIGTTTEFIVGVRADNPGTQDVNMLVMGNPLFYENFIAYGVPTAPPIPKLSSVLFIPGTEASRLYYRDGIGIEHQLWEPSNWSNIPKLAFNPDGTSVRDVYTKDIIGHLYDNRGLWSVIIGAGSHIFPDTLEVYAGFETFMNNLVASSTINMHEWRSYPYDWRYDVRDIVTDGTRTETASGTVARVYLEDVVANMASSSATGKVTLVAHSNGGLVAKALMQKLTTDGKSSLVDRLVMIGTPQWGTPTDIGAMLHGDGQSHGLGIISYAGDVRISAATMPGPYDLLPSPVYFQRVADPVAVFDGGALSKPFRTAFTHGITSFSGLVSFVTDALGFDAGTGGTALLNTPLALDNSLVDKARATHEVLDAWVPPTGLTVTAIAGWGQLTPYSYAYATTQGHTVCSTTCTRNTLFTHTPLQTEDGDNTVVTPSAVGNTTDAWYFDTQLFKKNVHDLISHQDLTSATPIQNALTALFMGRVIADNYLTTIKPTAAKHPLTIIGGMSPVNILATDSLGNETGIVPLPGTDLYFAKQEILGSAVTVSGDEKFITLPQGLSYTVSVSGYATGPANIQVQDVASDGSVTQTTTFADIPVTEKTTGTFSLSAANEVSKVSLDLSGSGTEETSMTPTVGALVSYQAPSIPVSTPARSAGGPGYNPYQAIGISSTPQVVSLPALPTSTPPIVSVNAPTTTLSSATSAPAVAVTTSPPGPSLRLLRRNPVPTVQLSTKEETPVATTTESQTVVVPQTAAAYDALSQATQGGVFETVYHWVVQGWTSVIGFFVHIL